MRAEIPQFEVYKPIPVSRRAAALGGLISILQTPGLVVDRVVLRPVEGRSSVGVAVTIDEGKKGFNKNGMYLYEPELNFIEGLILEAQAASNTPLARVIDIWTAASQALKEAKEQQT